MRTFRSTLLAAFKGATQYCSLLSPCGTDTPRTSFVAGVCPPHPSACRASSSPVVSVARGLHRHVGRPSAAGPAFVRRSRMLAVLLSSSLTSRTVDSGSCRIFPVPADPDTEGGRRCLSEPRSASRRCCGRRLPEGFGQLCKRGPDPGGLRDIPEPLGWADGARPALLPSPPAVPGWRPRPLL